MKIVTLGTLTNKMNGSARSYLRLVNLLSEKNVVFPIIPDADGIGEQLKASNERTIIIPYSPIRRSLKNLIQIPFDIYRLNKEIAAINPDIIHVNDIPWFYVYFIAKKQRIPIIMHSRYSEKNLIIRSIIRTVLKKYDAIIFVSCYNKNDWVLPETTNTYVLHNPGVFEYIHLDNIVINEMKPYVLIVSRISQEKGILEAIKVFSDVCKLDTNIKLVIAGDAQLKSQFVYQQKCKQYVSELGLDERVFWLGKIDYPHTLYKHAYCYLHVPNFEDPFPTTIMEALALGCRIVTREKGGIPEQVKGFSGVLTVDPFNDNGQVVYHFLQSTPQNYDRSVKYRQMYSETEYIHTLEKIIHNVVSLYNK